ncbi:MAG: FG-GAP-like repeat-containing protein [Pirellulaceae bacterium]
MHVRRVSRLSYESLETRTCLSAVGFALHDIDNQPGGSSNMIFADLDGDGDQDLVSDHFWRPNLGDGTFADAIQILPRDSVDAIEAGDIDGDGDLDLLVTRREEQAIVAWHENLDGQGAFGSNQDIGTLPDWSLRQDRWRASLVDINDDQLLDVVVSSFAAGSQMSWHANLGSAGFAVAAAVPGVDFSAAFLESADLDEDGDQDLVLRTADATLLMQNTNQTFSERAAFDLIADRVFMGDIDGDHLVDVLFTSPDAIYGSTLSWHEANSPWDFALVDTHRFATADTASAVKLSAQDITGDGRMNVLAGFTDSMSNYSIWFEMSENEFGEMHRLPYSLSWRTFPHTAVDLDRDGVAEVVGKFTIQRFDVEQQDFTTEYFSHRDLGGLFRQALVDVDGDKDLDVIYLQEVQDCLGLDQRCQQFVSWYENTDGHGTFSERQTIMTDYNSGAFGNLQYGDLDGDGDLDLVLNDHSVLYFDDGMFVQGEAISERFVAIGDLNGDGTDDLVRLQDGEVVLPFATNVSLKVDSRVQLIDWDGDQDLDIVATFDSNYIWYENLDAGNFGVAQVLLDNVDNHTRFHDINNDGMTDVIVLRHASLYSRINSGSSLSDEIQIANHVDGFLFSGNLDGQLGNEILVYVDGGRQIVSFATDGTVLNMMPTSVKSPYAVGDIDNDGDDDLLSNGLVWHESRPLGDANGDGVFDSSDFVTVFQAGEFEDSLDGNSTFQEGDWNGDGDFDTADLVAAFAYGSFVRQAVPVSPTLPHWCVSPDDPRLQR